MNDTNTFRPRHDKKVSFFDCHRRFLQSNHPFKNNTQSFLKGKPVNKGAPKRKFGADIIKMLKNGVFEGYGENHNWTHKVISGKSQRR
jgi:hypothetical protein